MDFQNVWKWEDEDFSLIWVDPVPIFLLNWKELLPLIFHVKSRKQRV